MVRTTNNKSVIYYFFIFRLPKTIPESKLVEVLVDKSPGLYFFSIRIGNDIWYPNTGFKFKPDAKDHVANLAFGDLYEHIRKRETEEIDAKILEYKIRTGQLNKKKQWL